LEEKQGELERDDAEIKSRGMMERTKENIKRRRIDGLESSMEFE
jgi:hypothetical protein